MTYRFTEHGVGYRAGHALRPWRPQYSTIVDWTPPNSRVLDVGCGDGILGKKLAKEKGCRVFGFDLDPTGVAAAKQQGVNACVHDADRPFPYKKGQFDVVICNEVLEFVRDPNFVVSEILRVGKAAIVEFPNFGFWFYRLQMLAGHFPSLSLYGHTVWETRQTKFFTLADFLRFPALKKTHSTRHAGIDWSNRRVGFLASRFPNLCARSVLLQLVKT